MMMINWATNTF